MTHNDSELRVLHRRRDGRRRYDESSKLELIKAALRPGVSVARIAQEHAVNANLLRKWINKYLMERERSAWPIDAQTPREAVEPKAQTRDPDDVVPEPLQQQRQTASSPAFARVISSSESLPAQSMASRAMPPVPIGLHVRLANGVQLEVGKASIEALATIVQMLGSLPCSGSTTD
ncbi:transposase [Robbsia andropogonis]|uniref:transposase n=1 Tax=Robbsia andropogonis TaxID=28092 RepID=UPI0020A0DFBF|nr:transposase [Robbsia andropogonis]MCP1121206.1 transposase [Robbsia andropogonis]MCP1131025.1 transposase [Robbsia andropogonis]